MESGRLPADLKGVIRSRLPVRSLVRSRVVCKEWSSIMDEPNFIATNLDRSKSLPPAITIIDYVNKSYNTIYLDDAGDPTPVSTRPLSMGTRNRPTNSVNGILCITHRGDRSIELLNPATGDSLVPPAPPSSENVLGLVPYLGFSPGTNEYKIVCLIDDYPSQSTRCEVYTVDANGGTGSWRRIQDFELSVGWERDYGICIDGKMYWITQDEGNLDHWTITLLDLATEESSDITISNFCQELDKYFYLQGLLELEGKLCVAVWKVDNVLASACGDMYFYVLGDDGEWVEKASFYIPWERRFAAQHIYLYTRGRCTWNLIITCR